MASAFQGRFKDRMSFLGPQGEFQFTHSIPVAKGIETAQPSLQFPLPETINTPDAVRLIKKTLAAAHSKERPAAFPQVPVVPPPSKLPFEASDAKELVRKKPTSLPPAHHQNPGLSPNYSQASLQCSPTRSRKRTGTFLPYTLRDYRFSRLPEHMCLGGLGSSVGSEAWMKKKELSNRQKHYGLKVQIENGNRFALAEPKQRRGEVENAMEDSRTRALAFAKSIKLPRCRSDKRYFSVGDRRPINPATEVQEFQPMLEYLKAQLLS